MDFDYLEDLIRKRGMTLKEVSLVMGVIKVFLQRLKQGNTPDLLTMQKN